MFTRTPRNDPQIGEFAGLPLTPQALAHADAWDESRLTVIERQCVPNGAAWAFRGPAQIRIWEEKDPTTNDLVAIKTFNATFSQTRTIWMDGRPHPGKARSPHLAGVLDGHVAGQHARGEDHAPQTLLPPAQRGASERSGRSPGASSGTAPTTDARDDGRGPPYLSEPLVQSQNFALVANVTPETETWTVCLASEIAGGRLAMCRTISRAPIRISRAPKVRLPFEGDAPAPRRCTGTGQAAADAAIAGARRGGARTGLARFRLNQRSSSGGPELEVLQVAADVYMIGGAGGNITVNVGSNGLFVVDAGTEGASANVVAAIRTISDRPIRALRTPVRMRTTSAGTLRSGRSVREFMPKIERKGR